MIFASYGKFGSKWIRGSVGDDNEEDGWDVHRQDCPKKSPETLNVL